MPAKQFTTKLAPARARWDSGYASSGIISPDAWAGELFTEPFAGPWLTCYMLRRFGWPNAGSDDHKNLCSWMLTTPVDGLYLDVTPYLGGGNIHFGVRFTKEVGAELDRDPEVEKIWQRREKAILRWWEREGADLYVFTYGDIGEDELVHEWNTHEGKTLGLWKRPDGFTKLRKLPKIPAKHHGAFFWWMGEFLKKAHPGVLPEPKLKARRSPTAFQRRVRKAIEAVLRDLARPVRVSDVGFSPLGRCDASEAAERFEGAGCTPEYWFSARRKRHERKKAAAR